MNQFEAQMEANRRRLTFADITSALEWITARLRYIGLQLASFTHEGTSMGEAAPDEREIMALVRAAHALELAKTRGQRDGFFVTVRPTPPNAWQEVIAPNITAIKARDGWITIWHRGEKWQVQLTATEAAALAAFINREIP